MPARFAFPAVAFVALCSAAMMWSGVNNGSFRETAWSAAAFAAIAVLVGWHLNRRRWPANGNVPATGQQLTALRRNGQLTALVYAWGAVALAAMYKLTGLHWQHGLQYAAGMLLLGGVVYGWTHLSRPGGPMATEAWLQRAARLNIVHGGVAALAVTLFLVSGKLWTNRPDWAANIVFLAGGFSIMALCGLAAFTHARLAQDT
jgi:hypothetical protein